MSELLYMANNAAMLGSVLAIVAIVIAIAFIDE